MTHNASSENESRLSQSLDMQTHLSPKEQAFKDTISTTMDSIESITFSETCRREAIRILDWLNRSQDENETNYSTINSFTTSFKSTSDQHGSQISIPNFMETDEGSDSSFNPPNHRTSTPIKKHYTKKRKKREKPNSLESDSDPNSTTDSSTSNQYKGDGCRKTNTF